MVSTPPEARELLEKWKKDARPLHVMMSVAGCRFAGSGWVREVVEDGFVISVSPTSSFTILFPGSTFEYSEPREAPENVREESLSAYLCLLMVRVAAGVEIALAEFR